MSRVKALLGSSYLRAVGTLSSGQLAASAIPIVAAPILGRLYLPVEYGVLAIYMAIANLLSVVATLQLHHAIIAEASEKKAILAFQLTVCVAFAFSLLTAVGVTIAILSISFEAALSTLRLWLWLLPLTVLGGGLTVSFQFLANRFEYYRALSIVPVTATAVTVVLSVGLGLAGFGSAGLLTAYLVGQLITALSWLFVMRHVSLGAARPTANRIKAVFFRHRRFATFTLGAALVSGFNMQVPIFALSGIGAVATTGAFTRARQLAGLPVQLVGGSVAQVFRKRAAAALHARGSCRSLYLSTMFGLFGAGLIPTAVLILYGPEIFIFVLGPNWGEAGELTRILAPMLLMRLAVSPISTIFYFTDGQRTDLMIILAGSALMYGLLGWSIISALDSHLVVAAYSIAYAAIYFAYIFLGLRRVDRRAAVNPD